jgi:hypothetical protein
LLTVGRVIGVYGNGKHAGADAEEGLVQRLAHDGLAQQLLLRHV